MTRRPLSILGIETSCDDTAVALVRSDRTIVFSSVATHTEQIPYGGVVPEISARAHLHYSAPMIEAAMRDHGVAWEEIDAIAATTGPGLIGGLMVGAMMAKGIALACNKPFLAINHLEGHALTPRLTDNVAYPYLLLLVSGGHSQLIIVKKLGHYECLGTSRDDAVGEAYDKVAKMIGYPYPGGPYVDEAASHGNSTRFNVPRGVIQQPDCHFSFSGMKTAVKRLVDGLQPLTDGDRHDICASFQVAVGDVLESKLCRAFALFKAAYPDSHDYRVVMAGGVASNRYLRARLGDAITAQGGSWIVPPPRLCTDNAAMIAWAAIERYQQGQSDMLSHEVRARWPLEQCK